MNAAKTPYRSDGPLVTMPYPGVCRVTLPTPFPGLPTVHVYLAHGPDGGLVMIDTSLGMDDSYERIEGAIRQLGRKVTDLEAIYLTHAHPDHFGLAGAFQEASGAPVVCHPICRDRLEMMGARRGMMPPHGPSGMGRVMPEHFRDIDEGDVVRFADSSWDVYWTPGHEWGHVVFFRPDDAVLISGDMILGRITPHIGWSGEPEDPLGQFMDSLDKVASLEPTFVIPGHGRSFDDGAQRAKVIKHHHEVRLRQIREAIMRLGPLDGPEVAEKVFGKNIMSSQAHLAVSETLAHLEYLRVRGRLERKGSSPQDWVYSLPANVVG